MKRIIITSLAILMACGACSVANAADSAARGGTAFRLGKGINRAIIAKPAEKRNLLTPIQRFFYKLNVYNDEGIATAKKEVTMSHGLFVHFALDEKNPKLKMGHSLAQ